MTGARSSNSPTLGGEPLNSSSAITADAAPSLAVDIVTRVAHARAVVDRAKAVSSTLADKRKDDRARDVILVDKAKAGDAPSFKRLVELHQGRLFAVAYGMLRDRDDAMDVVQDAFIKAHRKLAEFEGAAAFSTWLYRIAVNLCIDKKRADTRRRKVDLDDALATVTDDDLYAQSDIGGRLSGGNPLKNTADTELGRELGKALAQLTDEHRAVLLLREVDGMSYEEIADALSIPRGTVMSRLFHARKNMQRFMRPFLGLADDIGLDGRGTAAGDPSENREDSPAPRRLT